MNEMKKLSWLVVLVLIMMACNTSDSSEVNPQDIYQSYQYEYNAQTNKTKLRAAFQMDRQRVNILNYQIPPLLKLTEMIL